MPPQELSKQYTEYLQKGTPDVFAPGASTSLWRTTRQNTRRAGFSYQYIDQPLDSGAFGPLGLETEDGGALVFFSSKHFERQTAAKGLRPTVTQDVQALLSGEVKSTLTKERVSSQLVYVPKKGAGDSQGDRTEPPPGPDLGQGLLNQAHPRTTKPTRAPKPSLPERTTKPARAQIQARPAIEGVLPAHPSAQPSPPGD